jgi:hypothetical protein
MRHFSFKSIIENFKFFACAAGVLAGAAPAAGYRPARVSVLACRQPRLYVARVRLRPLLAFIFLTGVIVLRAALAEGASICAPAPAWDALFQTTSGWIGADGDYSLPLSTNRTLWLFSDSLVGRVKDGKRVDSVMIHNSIALQEGTNRPVFFYGRNAAGKAESFVEPEHGEPGGYFWLNHGVATPRALYFFALQVVTVDSKSVFGFKTRDGWLITVTNPAAPPLRWRMTQSRVPFTKIADDQSLVFGGAVLRAGGDLYVFGTESGGKDHSRNDLVVARVSEDGIADFSQWRFWSGGRWEKEPANLAPVFANVGSEYSVTWLAALKKYAAVYSDGISGRIMLRVAPEITGPWSEARVIYECPEATGKTKAFCYAAKAHPELAGPDELLITYAANAWDFWDLFRDASLYWPRFVRLKIGDH